MARAFPANVSGRRYARMSQLITSGRDFPWRRAQFEDDGQGVVIAFSLYSIEPVSRYPSMYPLHITLSTRAQDGS